VKRGSFSQQVFQASIGCSPWHGPVAWFMNRVWPMAHQHYLARSGADVRWHWNGADMLLPYAHALPRIVAAFPQYSQNLPRLAAAMSAKYQDLKLIDIGANVGDTACFVKAAAPIPILCVEGSAEFLPYLRANTGCFGDIEIVQEYLGERDETQSASIESVDGTAHLRVDEVSGSLVIRSLDSVLREHLAFADSKLMKSDTDGFEAKILRGSGVYLQRARPVLFLEYDPFFLGQQGDTGIALIGGLTRAGHDSAIVYDNIGDLMFGVSLDNGALIEQFTEYFSGRGGGSYADMAVFHRDDADLYAHCFAAEREHFRSLRGFRGASE